MGFVTNDSGERQQFDTGSQRDTSDGKPRYDLISKWGLYFLALVMARGAEKYDERNWEKGQPMSRFYESALRHLMDYQLGLSPEEDHLGAAVFNIFGMIEMREEVCAGNLPTALMDMGQESAPSGDYLEWLGRTKRRLAGALVYDLRGVSFADLCVGGSYQEIEHLSSYLSRAINERHLYDWSLGVFSIVPEEMTGIE